MYDEPQSGNWFGRALAVAVVWILLAGAGYFVVARFFSAAPAPAGPQVAPRPQSDPLPQATAVSVPIASASPVATGPAVEIGIAYGTEKKRWLEGALAEFQATPAGRSIRVKLIPMGSLEGAHAVIAGDKRIHVWSPASSLYRDVFVQEWQLNHSGDPIATAETLALTPMVYVFWKERYDAFQKKYGAVDFETISKALYEPGGWEAIAMKPEWGLFKFGHTHPMQSNSGLSTLVLMAYSFHHKTQGLTKADVIDPKFQAWLAQLEKGTSGLSNSTGNMMREMVLKGPSAFDAVMLYESVAIDYLKNAEGRWGALQVIYPQENIWNDNPYYVLNTEWSTAAERAAAETFLEFLMSEPVQMRALDHGFRPGNAAVSIKFPDSPFEKYKPFGLQIDLPTVCEPPSAGVQFELQSYWNRAVGR